MEKECCLAAFLQRRRQRVALMPLEIDEGDARVVSREGAYNVGADARRAAADEYRTRLETGIRRRRSSGPLPDEGLSVGVEQTRMRHVDSERQKLAEAGSAVRVEPTDNFLVADLQDGVGFGAGRLDHFDRRRQHRKPRLLRL